MAAGIMTVSPHRSYSDAKTFAMLEQIRSLNSPTQSAQSRRLPTGYFGIAVGIETT